MKVGALSLQRLLRDPRRSLQQCAGIGLVCAALIIWSSLTGGFSRTIYQVATRLLLGHIQIHDPHYLSSQSLYKHFMFSSTQQEELQRLGFISSPRVYQYALAAHSDVSKGVRIVGLDPALEAQVSELDQHLASGRFILGKNAAEIVVGSQLAEMLKLQLGSELTILGTAADGGMASGLVKVVGVLKPVSQISDQRYIYMPIDTFREIFSFNQGIHELVLYSEDYAEAPHLAPNIGGITRIFPDSDIKSWRQLRPQLARVLDLLSYTVYFTLGFVYLALGMLILNLKLMTTFDRSKEYGVMLALGLHPKQLIRLILLETLWLALGSAIFAAMIGIPIAKWIESQGIDFSFLVSHLSYSGLVFEPILYGYLGWKQMLAPLLFLLLMLPLAALYPAIIAARIEPSQAMQGRGTGL